MGKNRLLIYPYDLQFCPIVRHKKLLEDYEIMALVSPRGWGLTGKDGGSADNGGELGINVSSDFENNLVLCDTIDM